MISSQCTTLGRLEHLFVVSITATCVKDNFNLLDDLAVTHAERIIRSSQGLTRINLKVSLRYCLAPTEPFLQHGPRRFSFN